MHPDLLTLDAVRAGEAPPEAAAHVAACAKCRAAVEHLRKFEPAFKSAPVEVPAEVDRAILSAAPSLLRRRRWIRYAAPLAAAAALFLAIGLWSRPAHPQDIVDAYRLALRLQAGEAVSGSDINGDGKVDMDDAKAMARRCVQVKR